MKLSLVLVAHRSAGVLPAAVASFRAAAAAAGAAAEVVVVEQSEDAEELEAARRCRPDRLLARPNRGYAAGINAGVGAAHGEVVLVGNPDLHFEPGAVGALLGGLEAGWDVVGPQFLAGPFLAPPADLQTPGAELGRWLAGRWRSAWRRHLRAEVRRWRRVWEAGEPVAVPALSGALLGFRRPLFSRLGPWDEGYFLYFEETDWLARARRAGLGLAVVPAARVDHAWGHAADPARFAAVFAASRRRYYRRRFGLSGRWVARLRPAAGPLRPAPWPARHGPPAPAGALWLLSPSPLGFPAAGARLGEEAVPTAVAAFVRACPACSRPLLAAYDPEAEELLGAWWWEPSAAPPSTPALSSRSAR